MATTSFHVMTTFPTSHFYSWLSHRQKAETVQEICQSGEASWSLASLHSSSMTISTHQGLAGKLLVEKGAESKQCLFCRLPGVLQILFSLLMTSIGRQLVIKWSSSGHSHIWSSCLYRVLMLIFFTLPAMFFFRPSTYYDLLQWVSTCLNCREPKSPKLLPPAAVAQRQVDPHRGHPAAIRQTSVPGPCRFGLAQVRIQFHGQVHGTKIYHILYHHGWLNGCISTIMDDLMVP